MARLTKKQLLAVTFLSKMSDGLTALSLRTLVKSRASTYNMICLLKRIEKKGYIKEEGYIKPHKLRRFMITKDGRKIADNKIFKTLKH